MQITTIAQLFELPPTLTFTSLGRQHYLAHGGIHKQGWRYAAHATPASPPCYQASNGKEYRLSHLSCVGIAATIEEAKEQCVAELPRVVAIAIAEIERNIARTPKDNYKIDIAVDDLKF